MNFRILLVATGIGLALQLAMVLAGHYVPFIKNNLFAVGGIAISLVAGLLYGKMAAEAWGPTLIGGLVAGGVCAFLGIGVSVALKDVPAPVLAFGTVGSAVAGLVGGAIGRWLA
ncbi:MAG: hypothetical protein U1A07_05440 [Phenylobacterium sp.]|nr:hypothetical protein [Phenylobacterium sp.]